MARQLHHRKKDDKYEIATQIYKNSEDKITTHQYKIPKSLKQIRVRGGKIHIGAFSGLKNVEKIIISGAVTTISSNIFWGTKKH